MKVLVEITGQHGVKQGKTITRYTEKSYIYPARACAARGYVIGRGVYILYILLSGLFLEPIKNTHFERSILTQASHRI